jgi:hypothetical protein
VRQAETQKQAADGVVTARLPESYQWLLVPEQVNPQAPITWQAIRLTGSDALAVRASKKLRSDELLVSALGATILRKHLNDVPLWRGDHVAVKQLVEDFARYLYLPRLAEPAVLVNAIRDGLALLTWEQDTFAYAESYDEAAARYRGLRGGQNVSILDHNALGLLVKPDVARRQLDAETPSGTGGTGTTTERGGSSTGGTATGAIGTTTTTPPEPVTAPKPCRFHGSVALDPTRVGRDASRIAEEVIAHIAALTGAQVTVTLEIEATVPDGAPENVVRIVTENSRTLRFTSHGFETE